MPLFRRIVRKGLFSRPSIVFALMMAMIPHATVQAQVWRLQPAVKATALLSDNASYGGDQRTKSDLVIAVTPEFGIHARGTRFVLDGVAGVDAVTYATGSRSARVLPFADLLLKASLVDQWIFLDTALKVEKARDNPFGARPDAASSFNHLTSVNYRLSPYVDRELAPSWLLYARSDNAWSRVYGEQTVTGFRRNGFVQENLVRVERRPMPLGAAVEYAQQSTRYTDGVDTGLDMRTVRGVLSYGISEQLILGASAGQEHSDFSGLQTSDAVYGLRTAWRPSPRTDLSAVIENRFFGTGWDVQFRHRTPFVAFNLRFDRLPTTYPASLGLVPSSGDVLALLDAMFTTRYPDPNERQAIIADLVASRGLPSALSGPLQLTAEYPQLRQGGSLTVLFLGPRNALSATLYDRKLTALTRTDDPAGLPIAPADDNHEYGVVLDFNRRLTPQLSVDVALRVSGIKGLAARAGDRTTEKVLRLTMNQGLSPRTTLTYGVRRQAVNSNVVPDAEETAVFAGMLHRF